MKINQFDGEPRIFITQNGATMFFIGGQPVMDGGLENAVLISLFTKPNWYGNIFFPNSNQKIGSEFENVSNQSITIANLNDRRQIAQNALSWMTKTNLASEIVVDVTNSTSFKVDTSILIKPPSRDLQELILTKNGNNWIFQTLTPANRRI